MAWWDRRGVAAIFAVGVVCGGCAAAGEERTSAAPQEQAIDEESDRGVRGNVGESPDVGPGEDVDERPTYREPPPSGPGNNLDARENLYERQRLGDEQAMRGPWGRIPRRGPIPDPGDYGLNYGPGGY